MASLELGGRIYTQDDLLTALQAPRGDASVILARELAAARLNVAAGLNTQSPDPAASIADYLLRSLPGPVPQQISRTSPRGRVMLSMAAILSSFNHRCGRGYSPVVALDANGLVGDVDGDCSVSVVDFTRIAGGYGYSFGSLRYVAAYDLNRNGAIDIFDLQIAAAHFGERC